MQAVRLTIESVWNGTCDIFPGKQHQLCELLNDAVFKMEKLYQWAKEEINTLKLKCLFFEEKKIKTD